MVQKRKSEGRRDSKRRGGHFESSADETGSGSRSFAEPKLFKKHKAVFSHVPLLIEEPSKMKCHSKQRSLRSESSKKSHKLTFKEVGEESCNRFNLSDALNENRKFMKSILQELKVGREKMLIGLREEIRKVGESDNEDDNGVAQNPVSFECDRQEFQDQNATKKTTLGSEEPRKMNLHFTFERAAGPDTESCEKRDEPSNENSFNLCDSLNENRKFMKSILEDLRVGGEKMLIRLKEDIPKVRVNDINEEEGVTAHEIPVEGKRNITCDEGAEKGRLAVADSLCDPSMDTCVHREGFSRDNKEEFEDYSDQTDDAKRTETGFHHLQVGPADRSIKRMCRS
ncbi:uncharacterized protein LOC113273399 [Papaver somniferum]|uniref:uncharacterized protein LOC113273399 n=1 Tax=Papaver somniferum TaxID=3469 RepID=UPI000E6F5120|nr:uncharacterized protein LOC113273399 [Papaver somniferum]